jgi:predicted translin family RNA/ssDNA-binding protein
MVRGIKNGVSSMANIKGLNGVVKRIETELDEKEKVREFSIKSARFITRQSGSAIKRMQSGGNPAQLLGRAKKEALKLRSSTASPSRDRNR